MSILNMEAGVETTALVLTEATSDFFSGSIAGSCGVVSGQALDTIKTRQQASSNQGFTGSAYHVFKSVVNREGVTSLFKGMSYPLLTAALQNAVVFHTYGLACRHLESLDEDNNVSSSTDDIQRSNNNPNPNNNTPPLTSLERVFWSGCFAGAVQTAIVTPVDLLKIRLQIQTELPGGSSYIGPLHLARNILKTDGLKGLYRGTVITTIRDVPSHGVYFAAFEAVKRGLEPGKVAGNYSAGAVWAAGGLAGSVSWLSVYAFDVLKTRIQSQSKADSPYKGWVDCALKSYREEGLRVFFRGLPVTLGRAFVVNGAIFSAFEASHNGLKPFVAERKKRPPKATQKVASSTQ